MYIININKFNRKELKIDKENGKIITKYNNNKYIIEPFIAFNNCLINRSKNPYRIRFNIDINKNDHFKFKNIVDIIYDKISEYIEMDDNINISKVINPLFESKILIDNYVFYGMLNNYTIIKDIDTKDRINIDSLFDKKLIIYPYLLNPNINISNEIVYINFFFHTIYVKIENKSNLNKIEDLNVNIDHIEKEINKYL